MRENGPVIYEKINTEKGGIAKIMLNRPDHGNRIDARCGMILWRRWIWPRQTVKFEWLFLAG